MDTRDDERLDGGVRAREKAKRPQRSQPPKGLRHFLSSPTLTFPMPASRRWCNSSLPPPPTPVAISSLPWAEGGSCRQAGTRRGRQGRVSREQRVCDRDLAKRRGGAARTGPHKSQGSVPRPALHFPVGENTLPAKHSQRWNY